MIDREDHRKIRCRRLGHEVPFRYCRTLEGEAVCPSIRNCWWETFDVDTFLRENLSPEEYERLAAGAPPKPKLASILEIIEAAKRARPPDKQSD